MLATLNIKVKYRMLPGGAINILCENVDHHKQVMEILHPEEGPENITIHEGHPLLG